MRYVVKMLWKVIDSNGDVTFVQTHSIDDALRIYLEAYLEACGGANDGPVIEDIDCVAGAEGALLVDTFDDAG